MEEITILDPPTDGITRVRFAPVDGNLLIASSWDCGVRLYDVEANSLKGKYLHQSAVLDCCFAGNDSTAVSGGLDHAVKMYDFTRGNEEVLGRHQNGVRAVEYSSSVGLVVSGGWDNSIKLWDIRTPGNPTASQPLPGKVYSMSTQGFRLVVGLSQRLVHIFDLRKLQIEQQRESSLKFQTRCIECYPNGEGFALSSIEGRVAMEYFDPSSEVQQKKYAFKCHRVSQEGGSYVYPVNAIAFHPEFGTFATGGGDGVVCTWDGSNKKRLSQFKKKYDSSIASLDFNQDGSRLAIAVSYTFEEGEKDHAPDSIVIHPVSENEVKPKAKK